jgi:hypothetical protein
VLPPGVGGLRDLHSVGVLPDATVVVLLGTFPDDVSWPTAREVGTEAATGLVTVLGRDGADTQVDGGRHTGGRVG